MTQLLLNLYINLMNNNEKLIFLNSHYLKQLSNMQIYEQLKPFLTQSITDNKKIIDLIDLYKERSI